MANRPPFTDVGHAHTMLNCAIGRLSRVLTTLDPSQSHRRRRYRLALQLARRAKSQLKPTPADWRKHNAGNV